MSQIGEAVARSGVAEKITECPFEVPDPPDDPSEEDEDYAWDDRKVIATAQANDGGKLGTNVKNGEPGGSGSWNVLGGDPDRYCAPQVDTARTGGREQVKVRGRYFPFTVAAHHLIPGNASLYESQLFKQYMRRGGKIEIDSRRFGKLSFEVSHNIGYNVNGSHNGVWLPGSYAIEAGGNHPKGVSWQVLNSDTGDVPWCYEYMAAVARKTGGQFHDTHTSYNQNALKVLEKLTVKLSVHQAGCDDCRKKNKKKVPPPYEIKTKLFRLSTYLRTKTLAGPRSWRLAWMTSDQVKNDIFGSRPLKATFLRKYRQPH